MRAKLFLRALKVAFGHYCSDTLLVDRLPNIVGISEQRFPLSKAIGAHLDMAELVVREQEIVAG